MEADWLTPQQAADLLQVSLSTIRARIRRRELPARRLRGSRLLRISRTAVVELLEPLEAVLPAGRLRVVEG